MNKLIGLFLLSLSASLSGVSHQVEAVAQGVEERVAPTGQLVVIDQRAVPQHRIVTIDAATKTITPLFSAPDFSRIHQLAVSPDGHSVIFAYTPPPSHGSGFFDRSAIYRLPLDTLQATPERLFGGTHPQEFYLEPTLSPDGRFVFYVKVAQDHTAVVPSSKVTLERYDTQTRASIPIAANGIWPRVSPDGTRLTFIGVHPQTQQRGLFIAAADGTTRRNIIPVGTFFDIDTPVFSADGRWIYFSVAEQPSQTSRLHGRHWQYWLERLFGVSQAHAHADHNIPSDWWRMAVDGGTPERLTHRQDIILHGAFDPHGQYLAYSSLSGFYLMTQDGSNTTTLLSEPFYDTLNWLTEDRGLRTED